MIPTCPNCDSERVDELIGRDWTVRRYQCLDCEYRWNGGPAVTHYLPMDSRYAICGVRIGADLHAAKPTCDECVRLLEEEDANLQALIDDSPF